MIVTMTSLKGGSGKTTTSIALAGLLAAEGRTLLIDADPQQSALGWSEAAGDTLGCDTVALAVRDLPRRLPTLRTGYDHVVIDTPPGDLGIIRGALLAADHAVVPLPTGLVDLAQIRPTLQLIAEVEGFRDGLAFSVLLTRVRAGTRAAREIRESLVASEIPVMEAEVPLREEYATNFGSPIATTHYGAVLAELRAVA